MPVLTNIIATRPLTPQELADQGWTSHQMCYDTRHSLHYFRLMPGINGEGPRMLFGMRGGTSATRHSNDVRHRKIRADFERIFPAWRTVETPWFWSGLVCLTQKPDQLYRPYPRNEKRLDFPCLSRQRCCTGKPQRQATGENDCRRNGTRRHARPDAPASGAVSVPRLAPNLSAGSVPLVRMAGQVRDVRSKTHNVKGAVSGEKRSQTDLPLKPIQDRLSPVLLTSRSGIADARNQSSVFPIRI